MRNGFRGSAAFLMATLALATTQARAEEDCNPLDPLCVGKNLEDQTKKSAPRRAPAPKAAAPSKPSAWEKETRARQTEAPTQVRRTEEEKKVVPGKGQAKDKKTVLPSYTGSRESIEGLKSSVDGQGNWTYDFSNDGLQGGVEWGIRVSCSPPREKPVLPCFDAYHATFANDPKFPDFDVTQAKGNYVKMLQCMDKCVTHKDAEYLAGCVNWSAVKKTVLAAEGVEGLPEYFSLLERGGFTQCAGQDQYTAILKGVFQDSHSADGKCRKTGFQDFQYGRWDDPIIVLANSESTLKEQERLTGLKDRAKHHSQNLAFVNGVIDGLLSQREKLPQDAELILLDQHSGRSAKRIKLSDPDLASQAKSLLSDWENSGCGNYCVPIDQAVLSKLPEEAAKVKAGQKLFDINGLGQYTTAPTDSAETRRAIGMLHSGSAKIQGAEASNVASRAAKDVMALSKDALQLPSLPADVDPTKAEVLLDGVPLKAIDYRFDPKTRQLQLKKELPTQGLHLIRLVYPHYF